MNPVAIFVATVAFAMFSRASSAAAQRLQCRVTFRSTAAIVAVLLAILAYVPVLKNAGVNAVAIAVFFAAITVCAITDFQTGLVFDVVTYPALTLIILSDAAGHIVAQAVAGALACAAVPLIMYLLSRGRGIGLGDLKLVLCIGAALGVRQGLLALALAFITGGIVAATLLLVKRAHRGTEMRFAPFLAAAAAATMSVGL